MREGEIIICAVISSPAGSTYNSAEATIYRDKSKINLDIVLYCLNIQDNNRYNICKYSFRYNIKIVVSRILPCLENNLTFSNHNDLPK